mgnify:CR=1 FL=1
MIHCDCILQPEGRTNRAIMYAKELSLQNIGPFKEASLTFFEDNEKKPPVVLITGENGTGKSIILDAIRGIFGPQYCLLERDIRRSGTTEQSIKMSGVVSYNSSTSLFSLESTGIMENKIRHADKLLPGIDGLQLDAIPFHLYQSKEPGVCPNWILDYWPSSLASGQSYNINSLANIDHYAFMRGTLQGTREKSDLTQLICHLDYLRDSRDPDEKHMAEHLWGMLERIFELSLLDGGKLSHVARTTYDPIIIQNGQQIRLGNLSSGNLYLVQHLLGLLRKMYSSHFIRKTPVENIGQTPGILIIDEAENQLHPKWQKRFISSILTLFPNLQIIATTHSPFIISSVPHARLFVCKAKTDYCEVVDETAEYANRPVDEILMSPLFESTSPFNQEITDIMARRKQAIQEDDQETKTKLEKQLKELNPSYFSYLDIDDLIGDVLGKDA